VSGYQDEGIIDVERRKTQVEYTLGDPTVFPPEFLTWLKRFIEQSGITLPASAIFGSLVPGGGSGSLRNIAAGVIVPFAGPVAPAGSLPCNGQTELIDDFPVLHEIIGATWGPQTATTFTIPDLRDRALFGAGALLLAATDGNPHGQRGPTHKHSVAVTDPGHNHTINDPGHGHSGGVAVATHPPFNGNFLLQNGSQNLNASEAGPIGGSGTGISINNRVTGITVSAGPGGSTLIDKVAHAIVTYVITTG